ncbi:MULTISPECIES: ABC transporter permease [Streptomyces]|uniref:Transport permease protein n=1 Tax=Streptomyces venezuelae (strain ATCC 10712 / CBS 650.69 / DSM 40230 / JCM 4526 / NBRC 13096 / PD 04745) TaxID=953739 RepID=F2R4A9_STRVP|nr:ABC transporter permease [Streptomyces venezuelae]APE19613.1 multidrug ABC transporter permease [Streptomyces venezuelae]QER97028.1 ABC transporter permease [Streptomyces venezuelae ATCC 10712]CCA53386.1 ABC-type multidrug transport system, permease component [Streptomyces venezuelae ATCC 10712]
MPTARATAWRTWQMTRRAYPWTYAVGTVLPAALTIALAYLGFHAIGGGEVGDDFAADSGTTAYLAYIVVGATAFQFTVRLILWSAKALITEQRQGTLGALLIAPAARLPYLLGFTGFAVLSSIVEFFTLGLVVAALGITVPVSSVPGALLGALALIAAVFALSVGLGGLMIAAGEAHISQNTVFIVLGLVSGFTFPRDYLPEPARWFAELLPTTSAMDVLHGSFTGGQSLPELLPRLAVCALLTGAYLFIGLTWLPRAEARAAERTY